MCNESAPRTQVPRLCSADTLEARAATPCYGPLLDWPRTHPHCQKAKQSLLFPQEDDPHHLEHIATKSRRNNNFSPLFRCQPRWKLGRHTRIYVAPLWGPITEVSSCLVLLLPQPLPELCDFNIYQYLFIVVTWPLYCWSLLPERSIMPTFVFIWRL